MRTAAERKSALRDVLGSLAIEGQKLDTAALSITEKWVRGSITLEQLGSLFDDVIYDHRPEARIDSPAALSSRQYRLKYLVP